MKILPFIIPKAINKSFHVQEEKQPYFYDSLHQHPEVQITLILSGQGRLIAGDYIGAFNAADIFIIGPNMPHVFRSDPEYYIVGSGLTAQSVSIFFEWQAFGDTFWSMPEVKRIFNLRSHLTRGLIIEDDLRFQLGPLIKDMANKDGFERLILLFQILSLLGDQRKYSYLASTTSFETLNAEDGERLNRIYHFTMKEFKRQIKLEEIAHIANMTINSFCRFFKKRAGKTYLDFLNEIRIGHACKLLLDNNLKIFEICFEAGFGNLTNFNRKFKKVTGYTPSEYREIKNNFSSPIGVFHSLDFEEINYN